MIEALTRMSPRTGGVLLLLLAVLVFAALFAMARHSRTSLARWEVEQAARREARAHQRKQQLEGLRAAVLQLHLAPNDSDARRRLLAEWQDGSWLLSDELRNPQVLWRPALSLFLRGDLEQQSLDAFVSLLAHLYVQTDGVHSSDLVEQLAAAIAAHPENRALHGAILRLLQSCFPVPFGQSEWLYHRSLDALAAEPSSSALPILALQLGRWHHGRHREDGKVTIYDEQAIENDIAVRRRL